jgi:lipopolysaccharide export system protein LptC
MRRASRPSASEEVASLVYDADGRRHQDHTAKAVTHAPYSSSNHFDASQSLPWIERSQILNW